MSSPTFVACVIGVTIDPETKLSYMTELINTHEAKSRLSEIIRKVENGADVAVARNGKPVVRIIPWAANKTKTPGAWEGLVTYNGSSNDAIGSDEDIQQMFEESVSSEL